jgi:hypothetical protein
VQSPELVASSHQKSAKMNVCTISESRTMAGHSPEPIACSKNESPSMICGTARTTQVNNRAHHGVELRLHVKVTQGVQQLAAPPYYRLSPGGLTCLLSTNHFAPAAPSGRRKRIAKGPAQTRNVL